MSEQQDFVEQAIEQWESYQRDFDLISSTDNDELTDAFLAIATLKNQWATTLALLSLAQDVRRVADALEEMRSTSALRVDLLS